MQQKSLSDCKDTVVVVPAGCGKSAILYDIEKIQAWSDGDGHSCVTSKLYQTEPGATFVWIDMHIFGIFHLISPFSFQIPFKQIYDPHL